MRPNFVIRTLPAAAVMAMIALGNASGQADTGESNANQVAWLQSISAELHQIHLELLEDRRDFQQAKMPDLERDLETIQAQEQQLQEEQRSQIQQAADMEAQLVQASLTRTEREELEEQRADLLAQSPSRFTSAQNALAQREARARRNLALQEQRVQAIEQQLQQLVPGAP